MIFVLIIPIIIAIAYIVVKNSLIGAKNGVVFAKGSLDAMLKKRYDLIPNLIATIQNYTKYEQNALEQITNLRTKGLSGNLTINEQNDLNTEFTSLGKSFIALSENYPDLKASNNYIELQHSLNENEEQIAAARRTYNASINNYNNKIQMFPGNLMANSMQLFTLETPTISTAESQNIDVKKIFNS